MTPSERRSFYDSYIEARSKLAFEPHVPYASSLLPNPLPVRWMAYREMHDEFARELPNIINLLVNTVHELDAWSAVLAPLDLAGKMEVLVEFAAGPSAFALCLPYAIKSRFAFATAHLCHQANQVKEGASWKDDLPLDCEIVLATADKYGKAWSRYGGFEDALKKIADRCSRSPTTRRPRGTSRA